MQTIVTKCNYTHTLYVPTYHTIEGNFYMVQTFAVFMDDPTAANIKTAESFYSQVGIVLSIALSQK